MSIRLHPKYGVNPSLGVCFWCGKENGNILLLGYNKDKEAPRRMVSDYDPCDECQADWDKGIALIELVPAHVMPNRPQIAHGCVPTGRLIVMSEAWATRLQDQKQRDALLRERKGYTEPEVIEYLLKMQADSQQGNES